MRCTAHTFNLVDTADANKAFENGTFKLAYRKAMSKAQALWNIQGRGTVAADLIVEELKRRLVVPNTTRWNSTYDAVNVLIGLMEKDRRAVQRVMLQLKLLAFTDAEIVFFLKNMDMLCLVLQRH